MYALISRNSPSIANVRTQSEQPQAGSIADVSKDLGQVLNDLGKRYEAAVLNGPSHIFTVRGCCAGDVVQAWFPLHSISPSHRFTLLAEMRGTLNVQRIEVWKTVVAYLLCKSSSLILFLIEKNPTENLKVSSWIPRSQMQICILAGHRLPLDAQYR